MSRRAKGLPECAADTLTLVQRDVIAQVQGAYQPFSYQSRCLKFGSWTSSLPLLPLHSFEGVSSLLGLRPKSCHDEAQNMFNDEAHLSKFLNKLLFICSEEQMKSSLIDFPLLDTNGSNRKQNTDVLGRFFVANLCAPEVHPHTLNISPLPTCFRPSFLHLPPPSMKTRADLKRELAATVPPGQEGAFLVSATSALDEARASLQTLRDERVRLKRLISIRERKHQDWKGKVPRGNAAPTLEDAEAEVARAGAAPCHRVADVALAGDGVVEVRFRDEFKRALNGVDGFEKIWVIALATGQAQFSGGSCVAGDEGEGLYLWLADVVSADEKTGVVRVRGLGFVGDESRVGEVTVVDVKPYLPYCEAWSSSDAK